MSGQRVPGRHQPVAAKSAVNETQDPVVSAAYRRKVDPEQVLRRVLAVRLSETYGQNRGGRASTISDLGGPPGGLVSAHNRWVRSQAPSSEDVALQKSRRRIVKAAGKGKAAPACIARGYLRYAEAGGRLDFNDWARAVST